METAQESKAQGWVSGHDVVQGPRDSSWDSLASRQATRMGLACVALTTTSITYTHKKSNNRSVNKFSSTFLNFSTLILTVNL